MDRPRAGTLVGLAPVDAYAVPDRHRRAVHLMTPADVFRWGSAYHRIKTHGGWDVQQPCPGIYVWRDRHGAHFLVDHTGTLRIRPSAHDPATRHAPPVERLEHGCYVSDS